jgi:hypothetical protein
MNDRIAEILGRIADAAERQANSTAKMAESMAKLAENFGVVRSMMQEDRNKAAALAELRSGSRGIGSPFG